MRKNVEKSIEKIAKEQALREKFEKEYAPILQAAKEEKNVQKEVEESKAIEEKVETANEDVVLPESKDVNELMLTNEDFKKRVENKLKDWKAFLEEHKWLSSVLGLENKDTEIVVSNYRKYISDNPKNIQIIVDALSKDGTLSLIQANTGSGKTNITNTVMNIIRENKKQEIQNLLKSINITNKDLQKKEFKGLKNRINNKVYSIENKNAIKLNKLNKKSTSLTKKEIEFVENLKKEIDEAINKIKENYIKANYKDTSLCPIDEINSYVDEFGAYVLTIILCPNKIQNIQNQEEEEYTFKAIVGNGKNQIELEADTNYSMVYDKVYDVISLLEKKSDIKIKLVVDEGHNLVKDSIFRNDAVSGIIKCVEKVISLNGSVAFITATPDSLSYFAFDKIISFIPEIEPHNYDKVVIYADEKKEDIVKYAAKIVPTLETPQIRLNSYNGIEKLNSALHKMGLEGYTVTSKDKEINPDGTYKNQMYENITKKSALPKAQYYIQTQILDAGTNIKGIIQEDGTIKQDNITPVYIMKNSRDCNFDSQEQFIARRRYAYEGSKVVIIMSDKNMGTEIYSKKEIFNMQMEKVKAAMKSFEEFYTLTKRLYANEPKEVLITNIKNVISTQVLEDNKKLHMECIYFNEETMSIEYNKLAFWKIVYEKWMEQFYFNREAYIDMVSQKLNMPVEVFNGVISDEKIDFSEFRLKAKINREKVLSDLCDLKDEDISLVEEIVKKKKTVKDVEDKELKEKVERLLDVTELKKVFKEAVKMNVELGAVTKRMVKTISINESLKIVNAIEKNGLSVLDLVRNKEISLKELKQVQEDINNILNNEEYGITTRTFNKKVFDNNATNEEVIAFRDSENIIVQKIKNEEFTIKEVLSVDSDNIRTALSTFRNEFRKDDTSENIITEIKSKYENTKIIEAGREYLIEEQFIRNNIYYLKGIKKIPSMEQKIILDNLLDINYKGSDGSAKQKRFGDKEISEIGTKLNKYYHTKKYTNDRVLRLINLCFVIDSSSSDYKIKYIRDKH